MPEKKKTNRGFSYVEFKDAGGNECGIQISSLMAAEGHIWIGCEDIGLRRFTPKKGWEQIVLQQEDGTLFIANNRMHLSQSQVAELLPHLIKFVETGEL